MSAGSIPDRRTTSGSTVVISVSGGVLTKVPLKDRPIAVRTAPTMTGVDMATNLGLLGCTWHSVDETCVTKIAETVVSTIPGQEVSGSGTWKCSSRSRNASLVPCWARVLTKLNSPSPNCRFVP